MYTYGLGLEKFFRAIKDSGEFLASRCPECGAVYFPCRIFCERCFAGIPRTFKVSGDRYRLLLHGLPPQHGRERQERPDVVGLIEIEGTDGAKFVHLLDVKPEAVAIGMKVKPALKVKKDRKGEIFDIKAFVKA